MDNYRLRAILLNLHRRLSDNDRERLHFYLKNDVPRPVGDDSTLSGTLRLMQSLFDQEKITENDFSLLIDAFKEIQCFDAVDLLKEHQRRMQLGGYHESTQSLASIMPSIINDVLSSDYEDDKGPTERFIFSQINNNNNNENNNNVIIDSHHVNINTNNDKEDTQSRLPQRKEGFWTPSFIKKSFFVILILFLLTLVILIVVVIQGKSHIDSLEAKSNAEIKQLNKTLIDSINERKTLLIKAGRRFGGVGGDDFDDSSVSLFTAAHYLSGMVYSDLNELDSCQFIYSFSHDNQSRLESRSHGNHGVKINSIHRYALEDADRIEEVCVRSMVKNLDGVMTKIVVGLQFVTTENRYIPPSDVYRIGGDVESERHPGYILGYATGHAAHKINQLQFFWYRKK